jgi:hypothetical protein
MIDELETFFDRTCFPQMRAYPEVLLHGQVLEDPTPLDDLDDPHPSNVGGMLMMNMSPFILDGAVAHLTIFCLQQTGNGFESRALSSTVRSQERDNTPSGYFDGDTFQNQDYLMVLYFNVVDSEYGR